MNSDDCSGIGAFPLPALLPGYMGSLHDSLKTAR
jgi:hypothetical protein